ncbi:MAG: hypothetical protein ACREL4_04240 [Gemmatimonadales bacterium]
MPLLAGLVAMVLALWISRRPGPAIAPDSVSYLGAAVSLARHGTLRAPFSEWDDADSTSSLTDYAPGYAVALAVPIATGISPSTAARWIQALALGASTTMVLLLLLELDGIAGALIGLPLLILPAALTDIHLWILSEPLFIAFTVGTLAMMTRRPDRPVAYGVLAALGNLVRFAGVSLVGAVTLWAVSRPGTRRERLVRGSLAAAPGIALHLWWSVQGMSPAGGIGGLMTAGLMGTLREGLVTTVAWLAPIHVPSPWHLGLAVAVAIALPLMAWRVWRSPTAPSRPLLGASALFGGCYIVMLLTARVLVAPDLPFDSRILAPLFVVLSIAFAAVLAVGWRDRSVASRSVIVIAVALWSAGAATHDVGTVRQARRFGLGYESSEWQRSPIANWLRTRGTQLTIYTSDPAGTWAITRRPARFFPSALTPDTVAAFAAAFRARPSALVSLPPELETQAPGDSLAARLGLIAATRTAFGTVWVSP